MSTSAYALPALAAGAGGSTDSASSSASSGLPPGEDDCSGTTRSPRKLGTASRRLVSESRSPLPSWPTGSGGSGREPSARSARSKRSRGSRAMRGTNGKLGSGVSSLSPMRVRASSSTACTSRRGGSYVQLAECGSPATR